MMRHIEEINKMIINAVKGLIATEAFRNWFHDQRAADGDYVVINNSFIYRKPLIKTSKNSQYLCLKVKDGEVDTSTVLVVKPGDLNADFKLFSGKSRNLPNHQNLTDAIKNEMERLGRLVFVLIGELQDIPATVSVNHRLVKKLEFDPANQNGPYLKDSNEGKIIVVNQLMDPESVWNSVKPELEREVASDLSSLEKAFADAFEKLQNEARQRLVLPEMGASKRGGSFIAHLKESVSKQRELYQQTLQQWSSGDSIADSHLREVMRIAYNFAEDALKVLQLLVSVADLKGVLLWCTIKEHFDVAEAFRNLPWTKSHRKPSLERYREIIAGARNHAFHNLLAFDRTIEADLKGVNVRARRLTLLPPYSRRKSIVTFDYEDREMVELLGELTRAPEVAVPFNFWKKNAEVMESFEKLLDRTEDALWALNRVQRNGP